MTDTTASVEMAAQIVAATVQGVNEPSLNIAAALADAAVLMMIGMGFVFVFLTLLIVIIHVMAKLVPDEPQAEQPAHARPTATGVRPEVVAAISSAVHQYRASAT